MCVTSAAPIMNIFRRLGFPGKDDSTAASAEGEINEVDEENITKGHESTTLLCQGGGSCFKTYRDPPARERPTDDIWPERDALSFTRSLVFYGTGAVTKEHEMACTFIMEARALRKKYVGGRGTVIDNELEVAELESESELGCRMHDGVVQILNADGKNLVQVPSIDDFMKDYKRLEQVCQHGAMRSFCFQRLQMLDSAFKMHVTGE